MSRAWEIFAEVLLALSIVVMLVGVVGCAVMVTLPEDGPGAALRSRLCGPR